MDEKVIHLTDGTTVSAKVNFATLYYLQKEGLGNLSSKQLEHASVTEKTELSARMIYVLLRSNGRNVTFDEALVLCPMDVSEGSEVAEVFRDFSNKLSDYAEKQKKSRCAEQYETDAPVKIDFAEYLVTAREMGMSEEEFWNSCPIFYNEQLDAYGRRKRELAKALSGR